jgi:hypothetical protein
MQTSKRTIALSVLLGGVLLLEPALFGTSGAQAFSVFGHQFGPKKTPAESLPPAMRISPRLVNPGVPGNTNPAATPPANIGVQANVAPAPASDPLQTLVEKNLLPADWAGRTQPVTREELAAILVKTLNHNTQMVEEFPSYRDVPRDYPAYVPIEVAREKKLLTYAGDHGFYHPTRPVTYADVYLGLSHAITGPPPNLDKTNHFLQPFEDKDTLSPELKPAVAKMAQAGFFNPTAGFKGSHLHPSESVTPEGLAPLLNYLTLLNEHRADLNQREAVVIPSLPAGLTLKLTPSTGIFEAQLSPGQTVYFSLVDAVDPLPKSSRVQAVVQEALGSHAYGLTVKEVRTPEDAYYQTHASLTITFPPRRRNAFMVPGETFSAVTEAVPVAANASGFGSSAPTPAPGSAPPPFTPPAAKVKQLPAPGTGANRPGAIPTNGAPPATTNPSPGVPPTQPASPNSQPLPKSG